MCLPGTESRGIINGHDPLIPKLDGGGDYNNEEEYMTMRSDRSEGGGSSRSTSFIQNLRQRLHQQLPSNGLPLTEVLLTPPSSLPLSHTCHIGRRLFPDRYLSFGV